MFLIQEFIDGQEYGIDVLNDINGNFIHCCTKRKLKMRSGETDIAKIVSSERFNKVGLMISSIFKHTYGKKLNHYTIHSIMF